ncbi:hypothetical protein SAMN05443573_11473 [Celeribacter indicus]|uniref:Short-chain alcohol dehydrogenase-like protein n=1 Tax=Celeribacter indicus TaxID=1208324 RepID=A0A0B5DZ69_9RHOB|nr:short-chain alcohol dehydrogenase-like protein [Celeribacter indicus]SDX12440.1 hypothetical protein SAMN05443573_11473 [Celeribacter indicus]
MDGGGAMLQLAESYTTTKLPATDARDQANACLYLASDMGKAVAGQILQVDNGAYM